MFATSNVLISLFFVFGISFLIPFCLYPFFIRWLKIKNVRSKGHVDHIIDGVTKETKEKTPSFGGILFILIPFFVVPFFLNSMTTTYVAFVLLAFVLGLVGLMDDLFKIFHPSRGITARAKSLGQVGASLLFLLIAIRFGGLNSMNIPFLGNFGFTETWYHLIGTLFFLSFILVGTSNAVNLTDGMDGLASSLSIVTLIFMAILGGDCQDLTVQYLLIALLGSLVAFFLFNKKPARIFMGDVGSLPLGGLIAGFAIFMHQELFLIFLGGMFVVETLSVILQVFYFKRTKKRIFACAPLHHHYQFKGQSEQSIVQKFAGAQFLFGLVGYFIHLLAKNYV